jgi:hypothetical protein
MGIRSRSLVFVLGCSGTLWPQVQIDRRIGLSFSCILLASKGLFLSRVENVIYTNKPTSSVIHHRGGKTFA